MKSTATSMPSDRAGEVGEEDQRALEHADEHDAVGMVGRDLGRAQARRRDSSRVSALSSSVRRGSGRIGGFGSLRERLAHGFAQQRGAQPAAQRGQLHQLVLQPDPRLGVALAQYGMQHLAEQHRLPFGEVRYMRRCRPSMPRRKNPAEMRATSSASSS